MNIWINRIQFLIAAIVVIFFATIVVMNLRALFPPIISRWDMEKEFNKNKEILIDVAEYLEKQENASIYITSTYKKEIGSGFEHITEDSMFENITKLFKKYKFKIIFIENNGIYFQRTSNLDIGRGVVYSINGEPPVNEYLTILEPLKEENWYFYEEE